MRSEHVAMLGELAEKGAKIFAPKPVRAPSYQNHKEADAELKKRIEKYWDSGLIQTPDAFDAAVSRMQPDCVVPEKIFFNHHTIGSDDFYFLSNQLNRQREVIATFRVKGKQPELWNPVTGKTLPDPTWKALEDGRTEVRLQMPAAGSIFVAFRSPTQSTGETEPQLIAKEVMSLNENWAVNFDPNRGPAAPVEFDKLIPWNESADNEIKYYSGSATYRKTFTLPSIPQSGSLWLDLGEVGVMANVTLNGKSLGLLWCPPFKVDMRSAAKPGKNTVEIELTNLWINRFIGDEAFEYQNIYPQIREGQPLPDDQIRKTFEFRFGGRNAKHWKATDALRPSGLIGPVRITEEVPVVLSKPKRIDG